MDKQGFVTAFNDALIEHGGGRYDYLKDSPITYCKIAPYGDEFVTCGARTANVTGDSLTGMLVDLVEQGVIGWE